MRVYDRRVGVEDLLRAGREAWPEIAVDRERYAAAVARHGVENAARGADLYIAVACVDGDAKAIEAVRAMLASGVEFAASKTRASKDQIADVTAHLSRILFVDEPERPAALRTYSARGDIHGYLRVIARRELIRVVNLGRREVEIDDDLIDGIVPPSDPEISLLRARFHGDVHAAMRTAVGALDDRDRALLRYAFVDGLNVDEIGKLYDVHRATAARWVAAARERLGTKIREQLAAQLKIDVAEVDSIVRLVQSRIDVSLDRVLGA